MSRKNSDELILGVFVYVAAMGDGVGCVFVMHYDTMHCFDSVEVLRYDVYTVFYIDDEMGQERRGCDFFVVD